MKSKLVTKIVLVRENYDNKEILDIASLVDFNLEINDPYYKTRTLQIGETIQLDGTKYLIQDINFLLHPLNHIDLLPDLQINCQVNVFISPLN